MRAVIVSIFGKRVGAIAWNHEGRYATFEYDPEYIKKGLDIAPLTMKLSESYPGLIYSFPENRGNCFCGLPGLISDALPDKYGTLQIDNYLSAILGSEDEITPLDRLCYIGKRAMGALEFEPSEAPAGLDESSVLNVSDLVDIAQEIFNNREAFSAKIEEGDKNIIDALKVGTSAGGAKPKAIIAYNEKTREVRSGQVKAPSNDFSYWILKLDGVDYLEHDQICDNPKGIGQIEYAYYLMAKACGINISECRLLQDGDQYHFMTKRFDRKDGGSKIHVQTLAAIAHYDRDNPCSYEKLFGVIRRLGLSYNDQEEMYRRMVFNVLSRNHDDHTKNHSFLMNEVGEWSLSPAYDLCYSYNPKGKFTQGHQMSLARKKIGFTKEDLISVGKEVGINKPEQIIDSIQEAVSRWCDYAKEAGVRDDFSKHISDNLILF